MQALARRLSSVFACVTVASLRSDQSVWEVSLSLFDRLPARAADSGRTSLSNYPKR